MQVLSTLLPATVFFTSTLINAAKVEPECLCTLTGDPHIHPFNGNKTGLTQVDLYGGGWTNMIKTSDCYFNVQAESKKSNGVNDKVAIKFGNDVILYQRNLTSHPLVFERLSINTVKKDVLGGASYTNSVVGCTVYVKNGGLTVEAVCSNAEYNRNFGGYCKACDRPNDDGPCNKGVMSWDVEESERIWDNRENPKCGVNACYVKAPDVQADTPATDPTDAPTDASTDDPTDEPTDESTDEPAKESTEDQPYETSTLDTSTNYPRCHSSRRLRNVNPLVIVSEEIQMCTTDAMDECKANPGKWDDAFTHCTLQAEAQYWVQDCDCLSDFCNSDLTLVDLGITVATDIDTSVEQPCLDIEVDTSNIVQKDNFDYATLDFASPTATDSGIHAYVDKVSRQVSMPIGWELCPDAGVLAKQNGGKCFLSDNNGQAGTCNGSTEEDNQALIVETYGYQKCYNVNIKARICIRRPTPSTGQTCTDEEKQWTISKDGNADQQLSMFKGTTTELFLEQMQTASSGTAAIAIGMIGNEAHMCLTHPVSQTNSLTAEIKTSPSYGLSLTQHKLLEDGNTFFPSIRNDQFKTITSHGGFCVRALNMDENMCIQVQTSGDVHFLNGENIDQVAFEAKANVLMNICPVCN